MKAFLGEPIGTFIVRTRTEAAARLLRYSDIPIADIAYRIGYASPSSLSKVFKQFYGISPLEYRNNKNFVIMKPAIISTRPGTKKRDQKCLRTECDLYPPYRRLQTE
ncbi:helix-turn-helix transcriptional regulator [Bacteroides ovatus]|nr:helix-turn-helix transcriptional regulator [Bacteroides ovatus]